MTRVAILDDYEDVALSIVDWTQLAGAEVDSIPTILPISMSSPGS